MTISYVYSTKASTSSDANTALKTYQAENKFKIGGEIDLPLTNIGNILSKNDFLYSTLRTARITELGKLNSLPTSGLSSAEQAKESAFARLTFSQTSTRLIKDVKDDNTAKADVAAVNYTLKDLAQAVTDYTTAKAAGTTTAADDTKFENATKVLAASYKAILTNLNGRLAGEGVSYSLNYNQAKKYLTAINNGLAALSTTTSADTSSDATATATATDSTATTSGATVSQADDPSVVPADPAASNPDSVDVTV